MMEAFEYGDNRDRAGTVAVGMSERLQECGQDAPRFQPKSDSAETPSTPLCTITNSPKSLSSSLKLPRFAGQVVKACAAFFFSTQSSNAFGVS